MASTDDVLTELGPPPKPPTPTPATGPRNGGGTSTNDVLKELPPAPPPTTLGGANVFQQVGASPDVPTRSDPYVGGPPTAPQPSMPAPVQRILNAAGAGSQINVLTPQAQAWFDRYIPYGSIIRDWASTPVQIAGAVGGATSQGVNEIFGERGGRDINPLLQSAGIVIGAAPPGTAVNPLSYPPFSRPLPIPPDVDIGPVPRPSLAPGETSATKVPPSSQAAGGPAGGAAAASQQPGMGAPQPAGAQVVPPSAAAMTPQEIANARTVADKQWLTSTQQPGVKDTTIHIDGITPTLAEQEQTVNAARELKTLKNLEPTISQEQRELLDRNNNLRQNFLNETIGSDVTRADDLKAANDKINSDLATVWQNKGTAVPDAVNQQIQSELSGSAGDLPPLKSAMKQVQDSLDKAGTDPEALYRTHRLINYFQSKLGQAENLGYGDADVQAALTRTKAVLAKTIDDAAPGFQKAMSDYSTARGPIDAAKALQDRETGLYDSQGRMQFSKVHSLMNDIITAQKWDAPNDPLAGVSDMQMDRLKHLHDDLKRAASAEDLARAAGSDTAQNAADMARQLAKGFGNMAADALAAKTLGPAGPVFMRVARAVVDPVMAARTSQKLRQRGMEMLYPPTPPNPLTQQGAPGAPNPLTQQGP